MVPGRHIEYETKVYEENGIILVRERMDKIIQESCKQIGFSTYEGRMEAARHITNYERKIPVVICKWLGICFFPTHSFTHMDNYSISSEHIYDVVPTDDKKSSIIRFTNDLFLEIPCSTYSIKEQYKRSKELLKLSRANMYQHFEK